MHSKGLLKRSTTHLLVICFLEKEEILKIQTTQMTIGVPKLSGDAQGSLSDGFHAEQLWNHMYVHTQTNRISQPE